MGLSTEAKARYNKTNRHNSHVARVPASSSVKRTVRYIIFGASILTNFSTVYLYVKKRPFTKAQTQFTCCHTYIKLALFRSGYSFFSVFYFYYYQKTKTRKTLVAGSEEKRNGCHSDSWTTGDIHVSCLLELSPSDFDFDFRWGFVDNRKAWSNSLTNTTIFFFLYVSGRDSHFEMFSGPDFEESYPNIWFLLFCRQIRTLLVTSREVILSRKSDLTCL